MSPSRFGDPRLDEILRYWLSKRRDGALPHRADIKPSELGAAVRHLNILDVVREAGKPLQFRHRLIGTHNIEWLGRDSTGQMVNEKLYGAAAPAVIASFTRIALEARPFYRKMRLTWHERRFLVNESVEMPLTDDGGTIAFILRGAVFRQATDADPMEEIFQPIVF